MNVISNTDSNSSSSSHGRKEADKSVLNDGMRTRIVSSGMSGSSLTYDDDRFADDEMAVIAAPPEVAMFSTAEDIAPAEIPPEPSGIDYTEGDNNHQHHNNHKDAEEDNDDLDRNHDTSQTSHVQVDEVQEEDDESEYEYEEDDDAAFSGFLMTGQTLQLATNAVSQRAVEPARIREDDDDDDEEEEVTAIVKTTEESPTNLQLSKQQPSAAAAASRSPARKPKWREPSRDAVNMSLRAERETTGGKRRLAQDLYRIMNQDTEEAGFSLQPKSEDAMDKWTIKLFQFDEDSNLAKDMVVLGLDHVELEMSFPEHYPFEPPFVRVVRPRFKRQTGFVMNGALCMELLTKEGWNPVNDIESVIVSIRSLLVVGDGRLQHACDMPKGKYETILAAAKKAATAEDGKDATRKRQRSESGEQQLAAGKNDVDEDDNKKESRASKKQEEEKKVPVAASTEPAGAYSMAEAMAAYTHLSDYHAKKGWDNSGWWSRKG